MGKSKKTENAHNKLKKRAAKCPESCKKNFHPKSSQKKLSVTFFVMRLNFNAIKNERKEENYLWVQGM